MEAMGPLDANLAAISALTDEFVAVTVAEAQLHARRLEILTRAMNLAEAQGTRTRPGLAPKRDMPLRSISAELGMAARVSDRSIEREINDAVRLTDLFPGTIEALAAGRVSKGHTAAILKVGCVLDDADVRSAFEQVLLEFAETHTAGLTEAFARQLVEQVHPLSIDQRYAKAVETRTIFVTELDDGMAQLTALLPAALAYGILDRLTRQGKATKKETSALRRAARELEAERAREAAGGADGADAATDGGADAATDGGADAATDGGADAASSSGAAVEAGSPAGELGAASSGGTEDATRGGRGDDGLGDDDDAHHDDADEDADTDTDADTEGTDGDGFDQRTLDQIRADIFTDMLLTGTPAIDPIADKSPGGLGAIRAHVQVTMPITTATCATDRGSFLNGSVPIDSATARRLAGDAPGFDRVMTHPLTGVVVAVDRYETVASQQRFLNARDQHCRIPGCRTHASRCDHDHTLDYALGGPTHIRNLACLCTRHHTMKHGTDWTVCQLGDGSLEWTSPTGRSYRDDPPPRVSFIPDDVLPPF